MVESPGVDNQVPFEAAIVVPAGFDDSRRFAGLSLLLRHVLSLQEAGARRIHLVGEATAPLDDPRVTVPVEAGTPGGERTVVVAANVTTHRQMPARLTFLQVPPDGVRRLGTDAHIWIAGSDRAAEVAAAIGAGEQPTGYEDEPLLDNEFVLPLDDDAGRRRAFKEHLNSLVKPTSGFFERLFMRRMSKQITRLLTSTPITPNHVSVITLGLALWSAYLVSLPDRSMLVAGGLLHIFMRVVDCVDGELARLRYQGSRFGQWLDSVGDGVGMAAYVAGIAINAGRTQPEWFTIGMYGVAAWCIVQGQQYYVAIVQGEGDGCFHNIDWGHRSENKTPIEALVARVEMMFRIDAITVFYGLLAVFGLLQPLLVLHLVSATIAIFYFGNQVRKVRAAVRAGGAP